MRIALIGPAYPYRGGIAHYTTCLTESLKGTHQTLLISFVRQYPKFLFPGRSQRDISRSPLSTSAQPLLNPFGPRTWRNTVRRILEFSPHVVLFQWWHPYFGPGYASIVKQLSKVRERPKCVFLCHNVYPHETPPLPGASWLVTRLIANAFREVDGFLVHSAGLAAQASHFNPSAEIRQICHPVYDCFSTLEPGSGGESPEKRKSEGGIHLLFFGKVRKYKGLEVFLRSLVLLGDRLDYRATVAGEFYIDEAPFRRIVDEAGISDRITWLDHYVPNEEVGRLFQSADLVVLPYLAATQSGVVSLAYGFGKPVIVSDVGGLSEVVREGETGYLVPPGDAVALAEAVLRFARESGSTPFATHIERKRAKLSWKRVGDELEELLTLLEAKSCKRMTLSRTTSLYTTGNREAPTLGKSEE